MRRRLALFITVLLTATTFVVAQRSAASFADRPWPQAVEPACASTAGGSLVHISGPNIELTTAVSFGGNVSTEVYKWEDMIDWFVLVRVPPHAAGPVILRAYGADGWGPPGAPFVYAPPSLASTMGCTSF
jgi:hypothetical protein